nr:EOG090X0B4J [Polyphemus pediculus]
MALVRSSVVLLSCLLVVGFSVESEASHNFMKDAAINNGPEDLLLDELVRSWKWAHARESGDLLERIQLMKQQQQQQQEEQLQQRQFHLHQNRPKVRPLAEQEERKFGYRPHEPGYIKPELRQQYNPIIPELPVVIDDDVRLPGQKEDVGLFDDDDDVSPEDAVQESGKFQQQQLTTERPSRDPIAHAIVSQPSSRQRDSLADVYLTALVAGCTASVVAAILALGVCFYRWQKRVKSAQDVEYPAYGITGPGPSPNLKAPMKTSPTSGWIKPPKSAASGDKKLAHSAHMFHFQHQKQQVIAMENHSGCDRRGSNSGGESDEDNEEGDYTVYECPGLAPTGEMEVKNPLFLDDPTPATPAINQSKD